MSTQLLLDTQLPVDHRYRQLTPSLKWALVLVTGLTVFLSVYQIFNLGRFGGFVAIDTQFFYALMALLLPMAFLIFPANAEAQRKVPWYDICFSVVAIALNIYFLWYARDIVDLGWEYSAPDHIKYSSTLLWVLVLEATRRAGGLPVFMVVFLASLYPVYAEWMPTPFDATAE